MVSLLMGLSSCGGGSESAAPPTNTPPSSNLPNTIPEALAQAVNQGIDGIFVYVDNPSGQGQDYVAGIENRTTRQAARTESLFKIASISKLYIAVAATKLITQNSIQLNDTLGQWLPQYTNRIENAHNITIRQMLEHRSGIPDFDSQSGFSWENPHTDIDQTLEFALDLPADFAPNQRYEYSNTNYLLLGKILDTALGYSHRDYIKVHIIDQLHLSNTYSLYREIDPQRLVRGYWNNIDRAQQDYVIPGGSMISTVEDTATFLRALNTGTLLSSQEKAHYVYFLNHSGWLPGYQSIATYHANIDRVVIQFINTTGGNSESIASNTYDHIIRILAQ